MLLKICVDQRNLQEKDPENKDKSEYLLRDSDSFSVDCPVELNPDLVDKDSKKYEDQK